MAQTKLIYLIERTTPSSSDAPTGTLYTTEKINILENFQDPKKKKTRGKSGLTNDKKKGVAVVTLHGIMSFVFNCFYFYFSKITLVKKFSLTYNLLLFLNSKF